MSTDKLYADDLIDVGVKIIVDPDREQDWIYLPEEREDE